MDSKFLNTTALTGQDTTGRDAASSLRSYLVKVLLIDDQAIIAKAVGHMLATEDDIVFDYCSDPTQAIQRATEMAPTLILVDLVMPDIDGLLLLRFLRANPATRDIPVVMLSSKEDPKVKAEAFAFGANDYLVKLPDKLEMIARIRYHSKAYINLLERNAAEKQLRERTAELSLALENIQTEKMSSLAQLVAGVAHEINNPVNFIIANLSHANNYIQDLLDVISLYQKCYPNPDPKIEAQAEEIDLEFLMDDLPKMLISMKLGADRIGHIVLTLRNFSRLDESARKFVNIHEGIDSTILILQHRLKNNSIGSAIEIIKEYGDLPPVECYAGHLNQVFMNILSNAIDALKDLRCAPSGSERLPIISIRTQMLDSNWIAICIKDNGLGITPEVKSRVFDPFFTTKAVGEGTGIGLSISYKIVVEKHQGLLRCESEPGKGTEFWIEIPLQVQNSSSRSQD